MFNNNKNLAIIGFMLWITIVGTGLFFGLVPTKTTPAVTTQFPNRIQEVQYNVVVEAVFDTPFGERHSIGSGVVISDTGRILTAAHVIAGAKSVRITLHSGKVFDIDNFYADTKYDIGIIDLGLPPSSVDFIPLSESDNLEKGCLLVHIGNANGIWTDTILHGRVYNPHFFRLSLGKDIEFIVAKIEIKPGCSGGGVYFGGKLVGIVKAYWGGAAVIIPSSVCRKVVEMY